MITNQHPQEQNPVSVLSEQEIQEIEGRLAEATLEPLRLTKPPWLISGRDAYMVVRAAAVIPPKPEDIIAMYSGPNASRDAYFDAHSRLDSRRMIATIRDLQQQLAHERTLSSHHLGPTGRE